MAKLMLLELLNGILQCHHILMNITGQLQDLLFAVQDFNALSVRVVAGTERPRDGGCIGPRGEEGEGSDKGHMYREARHPEKPQFSLTDMR